MERLEALETIRDLWENETIPLGEKIMRTSHVFHSSGLDLASTAAYIKATPSELDTFLALGELDDSILERVSEIDPPKTTWTMLASGNEEEILLALKALEGVNNDSFAGGDSLTISEYVYQNMKEVAGPSSEQLVGCLSGDDLNHALKKGIEFGALNDWQKKFLKSIANQRKTGKRLSEKQIESLISSLEAIVAKGAIARNSIDGDQDVCDRILDALGENG